MRVCVRVRVRVFFTSSSTNPNKEEVGVGGVYADVYADVLGWEVRVYSSLSWCGVCRAALAAPLHFGALFKC